MKDLDKGNEEIRKLFNDTATYGITAGIVLVAIALLTLLWL